MSYTVKNYTEQSGDVTHIGGKLIIEEGATVEGLPSTGFEIPVMKNQPDSESTTIAGLKEDFNALLAKLKSAGLMETDAEETEN